MQQGEGSYEERYLYKNRRYLYRFSFPFSRSLNSFSTMPHYTNKYMVMPFMLDMHLICFSTMLFNGLETSWLEVQDKFSWTSFLYQEYFSCVAWSGFVLCSFQALDHLKGKVQHLYCFAFGTRVMSNLLGTCVRRKHTVGTYERRLRNHTVRPSLVKVIFTELV